MKQLQFESYEKLVGYISDTFHSIDDKYGDVAVVAKYDEAKEIVRQLFCFGYDIASIDIHREEFENYYDEYLVSLNFDGVWCEKLKGENGYFTDESTVIYIMDNCSSAVIPYCQGEEVYEVSINDEFVCDNDNKSDERLYTEDENYVNGKKSDKEKKDNEYNNDAYSISVKCNIDADEVLEIIKNMENRITNINDMFREMNNFRRLFNW